VEPHVLARFRERLIERRGRLEQALSRPERDEHLLALLAEVDEALSRIARGTFGSCEVCREPIERERLRVDPLLRNCLDHLTETERRAPERDLDLSFEIQKAGCWRAQTASFAKGFLRDDSPPSSPEKRHRTGAWNSQMRGTPPPS
jgi:hypothetical protein